MELRVPLPRDPHGISGPRRRDCKVETAARIDEYDRSHGSRHAERRNMLIELAARL